MLRWWFSGQLPGWQLCRGISGSFRAEWVAGFVWNQWQAWSGIRKIIVTANKRSESLQEVPISVVAFSDEEIQIAGINNSEDLAIITPSLTINTNTQPFTARIQIRGIGTSQTDIALEPSVGLFVDDVYLARSGLALSDLTDIERIEVLQGPQGTLYGKNTNAGAISIFTKDPNKEEFDGYVEGSVGNYELTRFTLAASGPIADGLAYRISGNVHKSDGYMKNSTGNDLNSADDWNIIGKLLYEPTDSLRLLLRGVHVERDTRCCAADAVHGDALNAELAARGLPQDKNDPFDYKIAVDLDHEFYVESDSLSLVADYEGSWGTIKSITAWAQADGGNTGDLDRSVLDVITQVDGVSEGSSLSQELRLSSNTGGTFDYQAGLFYYVAQTTGGNNEPWTFLGDDILEVADITPEISNLLPPGITPATVGRPGDYIRARVKLDTKNIALFGQTTWHINERWRLTGGLRYTHEEKDADILVAVDSTAPSAALTGISLLVFATTPIDDTFTRATSDVNWLLSTSFDVRDDVMLYGTVATGSKSGGFNTVNGTALEREFDDESTISYELGLKSLWLDSRIRLNAAAFYTTIEDYQTQQQLESGIGTRVANQGEVEASGIDINVEALPLPFLTLSAGLLYMRDYEVTDGPQEGLALPFTADYSGNLAATLVFPLGDGGVFLRADYSYMDDHLTNSAENTLDKDIQDRSLLNLTTGWRNDRWRLALWAKNLTNEAYASFTATRLPLNGVDAYFLAPPRTYGATVRYNFD